MVTKNTGSKDILQCAAHDYCTRSYGMVTSEIVRQRQGQSREINALKIKTSLPIPQTCITYSSLLQRLLVTVSHTVLSSITFTISSMVSLAQLLPQGLILGPLLFILYINDLSPTKNTLSEPIIFAGDTFVIISTKNLLNFV
jgi:hypothetical protein